MSVNIRIATLALAAIAVFGCNSGDKMDPKDSMESTLREAQKNAKDEPATKASSLKKADPNAAPAQNKDGEKKDAPSAEPAPAK